MNEKPRQSFLDRCYKDKKGRVAVFQTPNLPIIVGLTSFVLTMLVKTGSLHSLFSFLSFGALFTWAWLEVFSGASYIRRVLGVIVLVGLLYNRL